MCAIKIHLIAKESDVPKPTNMIAKKKATTLQQRPITVIYLLLNS